MLTHQGTQTLHTPRLTLDRFSPEDARAMYDGWASDPQVTRFLTWPPHTSPELTRPLLESWPNLEYFALYSCSVTTDELSTMATRKLRRLQVKLYDDQPMDFSWLSEQPDLYWVVLSCSPDNAALASLAKAAPRLEYLYLSGKNITDFTPLQSMQLKKLAIHDISKETRTALEEMLPDVEITAR